jgi:hypothetical protein
MSKVGTFSEAFSCATANQRCTSNLQLIKGETVLSREKCREKLRPCSRIIAMIRLQTTVSGGYATFPVSFLP